MTTPTLPAEDELHRRARRRVNRRLGFFVHALVFTLVNLALWAINRVAGGPPWHLGALSGWGLGLAIHGLVTVLALQGEGWRERLLAQEVERLRRPR
jgi:hypothetical protein